METRLDRIELAIRELAKGKTTLNQIDVILGKYMKVEEKPKEETFSVTIKDGYIILPIDTKRMPAIIKVEDIKETEWKAKYEKCIEVIKRVDPGIISMYDL